MRVRIISARFIGVLALALLGINGGLSAQISRPAGEPHEHGASASEEEHANDGIPMARESSGTSWRPDLGPMYALHEQRGAWQLMAHENAFLQVLHEAGDRGDDQFGSINWVMGMAQRKMGQGRLGFRAMFSLERWTVGRCGYPDLLASGEQCNGQKIHDRQHPHDLVMELSAAYDAPLTGSIRWQLYGGPVAEPALGPVAYPHRLSAMPNPLAPIAHHWLDSTHVTFGVVSGGVFGKRWKAEGSVFNGRESDDNRTDFDFGALDSVSGRLWFLPTSALALQVSAGKLTEAEAAEGGGVATDVKRLTASLTHHMTIHTHSIWATTVGWGHNQAAGRGSNAVLIETNVTLRDRDTWFGRFEAVGKAAHDLALDESLDQLTVAKLQGGYTRYFTTRRGLKPGVGATLSAGFVPESVKSVYGRRVNAGFGVFVTLRPAAMVTHAGHVME